MNLNIKLRPNSYVSYQRIKEHWHSYSKPANAIW